MFLWFPVLDLARAPRRTARKKGSGYENGLCHSLSGILGRGPVGRCAKKCLEKQFRGNPLGNRFSAVQFIVP